MLHFKRRAICYISARLITGKNISSIFDYAHSAYFNYSGSISTNINIYDYSRSCYLTGNQSNIFDYGTSQYVSLKLNGVQFSGYDYETGNYFNGRMNGNSISFFDYQDGSYYNFSI